jgi:uncharacterized protein YndB with AHSA1/START domain
MPDIFSDVSIRSPRDRVYHAISTPEGLNSWWTKTSTGRPVVGAPFQLRFGPQFEWDATVTKATSGHEFELQLVNADTDWLGSRVGFRLEDRHPLTAVHFYHVDWPEPNEHWRVSCYCWPIYLRLLRRHLEYGEFVPYEQRLDV